MAKDSRSDDFAAVYDEYVWDVYAFLAYRLGDRRDAEDITQTAFEHALRAWPRFDPARGSARTWLFAIARNSLIDHHRRASSRPVEQPDSATATEQQPAQEAHPVDGIGISPELETALATLSSRAREVVALRFGADLTGAEIAAELDMSLANVQQILSRSLRKLRDSLDLLEKPGMDRL